MLSAYSSKVTAAGVPAHPGEVETCHFPEEEGVEIIAAVGPGKFISPYYDSMVAQIIVHAESREAQRPSSPIT